MLYWVVIHYPDGEESGGTWDAPLPKVGEILKDGYIVERVEASKEVQIADGGDLGDVFPEVYHIWLRDVLEENVEVLND